MSSIEETGEFNLIRRLTSISSSEITSPVIAGVGDDAAVYKTRESRVQVITTDTLIENYHFDFSFYRMEDIGYKAMAVNLSDIAAMNAYPVLATIAIGVPGSYSMEDMESLYQGIMGTASAYGVQIVGGDTTRSPVLTLTITVVGEAAESDVVYRSGATPGDYIGVTGSVGEAALGLDILRKETETGGIGKDVRDVLTTRHLMPTPRLDIITEWAQKQLRPSAMIDISDGLASEVHHICTASGCGAVIWEEKLPISPEMHAAALGARSPVDYALHGGDDYELLFTASARVLEQMRPDSFTKIGRITPKDVLIRRPSGTLDLLLPAGHDHFRPSSPA